MQVRVNEGISVGIKGGSDDDVVQVVILELQILVLGISFTRHLKITFQHFSHLGLLELDDEDVVPIIVHLSLQVGILRQLGELLGFHFEAGINLVIATSPSCSPSDSCRGDRRLIVL